MSANLSSCSCVTKLDIWSFSNVPIFSNCSVRVSLYWLIFSSSSRLKIWSSSNSSNKPVLFLHSLKFIDFVNCTAGTQYCTSTLQKSFTWPSCSFFPFPDNLARAFLKDGPTVCIKKLILNRLFRNTLFYVLCWKYRLSYCKNVLFDTRWRARYFFADICHAPVIYKFPIKNWIFKRTFYHKPHSCSESN